MPYTKQVYQTITVHNRPQLARKPTRTLSGWYQSLLQLYQCHQIT